MTDQGQAQVHATAAMPPRQGAGRVAFAVTGVSLVVAWFVATMVPGLGRAPGRHYDEGVYLVSARSLLGGNELFADVFSSQPPAFLEAMALALTLGGDSVTSARLAILAFATIGLLAAARIAWVLGGARASVVAVAALSAAGTFAPLSGVVQAETPSLALALACMVLALESLSRPRSRALPFAAGLLFGIALLFKLFVAPWGLALAMLAPVQAGGSRREGWRVGERDTWRGWLRRGLLFTAGCSLALGLPLLAYEPAALLDQALLFHRAKRVAYPLDRSANIEGLLRLAATTPLLFLSGVLGVALVVARSRVVGAWLLLWCAASLAAVLEQSPLFWRHYSLLEPPLAIGAGMLVAWAWPRSSWQRSGARASVALALVAALLAAAPVAPRAGSDARGTSARIAAWIAARTQASDLVAGDDQAAVYLAGRSAPPALCDTSHARIAAGYLPLDVAKEASADASMVVLREGGRLVRLRGFLAWLRRDFREVEAPEDLHATFWIPRRDTSGE